MEKYVKRFLKQKKNNKKPIKIKIMKKKTISKRCNNEGIMDLSCMFLHNLFDVIRVLNRIFIQELLEKRKNTKKIK